jgi:hypothetical protein
MVKEHLKGKMNPVTQTLDYSISKMFKLLPQLKYVDFFDSEGRYNEGNLEFVKADE